MRLEAGFPRFANAFFVSSLGTGGTATRPVSQHSCRIDIYLIRRRADGRNHFRVPCPDSCLIWCHCYLEPDLLQVYFSR